MITEKVNDTKVFTSKPPSSRKMLSISCLVPKLCLEINRDATPFFTLFYLKGAIIAYYLVLFSTFRVFSLLKIPSFPRLARECIPIQRNIPTHRVGARVYYIFSVFSPIIFFEISSSFDFSSIGS